MDLNIIFEDQYIIVVEKPPGVPSQKDRSGDLDMLTLLSTYLQKKSIVKDMPYIGLIHRLDRPVGGIMVFAKTPYANSKLSEQIRLKKMKKVYLTVTTGKTYKDIELLTHYLIKQHNNLSKVVPEHTNGAQKAMLTYTKIKEIVINDEQVISLLRVELNTGRHHQIRVQLSHIGLPIWGDTKYNQLFTEKKEWYQIALFAYQLGLEHPKTGKFLQFELKPVDYPFDLF